MKGLNARIKVVGVDPELAGDLSERFHAGRRVAWNIARTSRTIADGFRFPQVTALAWEHIKTLVDDIVPVTEEEIVSAMRKLACGSRLVFEPSGAVATVAALKTCGNGGNAVAVVSGGNANLGFFEELIRKNCVSPTKR